VLEVGTEQATGTNTARGDEVTLFLASHKWWPRIIALGHLKTVLEEAQSVSRVPFLPETLLIRGRTGIRVATG
jgi:hypothetical protein